MSGSALRRLARGLARVLGLVLPSERAEWAEAIARESEHVDSDLGALLFVLSATRGAVAERAAALRRTPLRWVHSREDMMAGANDRSDLRLALLAATLALATGLWLMAAAGAPRSMMIVNALTAVLALVSFPYARRLARLMAARPGPAALAAGGAILATAFVGPSVDGVVRWISVGPISLQLSLLALPPLAAVAALRFTPLVGCGVAIGAAGLALQPDRAMAAALALAMAATVCRRPDAPRLAASLFCCAAAALAFERPDPMPAVPFVDQLVPFAAERSFVLAAALAAAMVLLVLPFLRAARRPAAGALAAAWAVIVAAAFLGNYPSPLVGYGASAILGYALSCAFLAVPAETAAQAGREAQNPPSPERGEKRAREFTAVRRRAWLQ